MLYFVSIDSRNDIVKMICVHICYVLHMITKHHDDLLDIYLVSGF